METHSTIAVQGQEVVGAKGRAQHAAAAQPFPVEGHEAGQWRDQFRERAQEPPSLPHRFEEARQVQGLEIAQAPVDDPEALEAGLSAEVPAFDEQ